MAATKIATGFRFDEELLLKLGYIAKKNHRSMNAQLVHLVEQHIEEYEAVHGEIVVDDPDKYRR